MKIRLKTEDKLKTFRYCGAINGNIGFTVNPRYIKKNVKEFGLNLDFEDCNIRYSRMEGFVIVTPQEQEGDPMPMQFLVTRDSRYKDIDEPFLKEWLKPAFDALNTNTLADLLNFTDYKG